LYIIDGLQGFERENLIEIPIRKFSLCLNKILLIILTPYIPCSINIALEEKYFGKSFLMRRGE